MNAGELTVILAQYTCSHQDSLQDSLCTLSFEGAAALSARWLSSAVLLACTNPSNCLCCCRRSRSKPQRQRLASCLGWSSLFWGLLLTVVLVVQAAWQAADYCRFPAEAYGQLVDVTIDNTDREQLLGPAAQQQLASCQ